MPVYRALIGLTVAYVALLLVVALTPSTPQTAESSIEAGSSTPVPGEPDCVVCGVGEQCNPSTGQCELVEHTPLPCIDSATFDEEAGFCLPTGEPTDLGPPEPTEEPDDTPRGREPREPREPRQIDLPGFGD